jgi:hypothetical protein
MAFTEDSDPIQDMGIGTFVVNKHLKSYTKEELDDLYNRIRGNKNIKVYGTPFKDLDNYHQIDFNNDVVKALNCITNKENREKAKARNFKEGDVLTFKLNSKQYTGAFSGIDNQGRILGYMWSGDFKIGPKSAKKVSKAKAKVFFEDYERQRLENDREQEDMIKRMNERYTAKMNK